MKPATKRAVPNKRKPSKKQREKQTKAVPPPSLPSSSTKSITIVKKNKNIKTKAITELKPPSSPYTVTLPQTTKPILPSSFSPSTPSKKELSRLGGLRPVLKLLSSRKSSLSQTAALVLSNCTGEDRRICRSLIALQDADSMDNNSDSQQQHNDDDDDTHEGLGPLIEHLTDSDATVALHVAKTLAHCTAACQDRDATLHLSSVLRRLGGTRLLIGCLSPLPQHEKVTAAVLLSLGNLCCDDTLLCNEMRELGALESLLLLLRPGRPLVLRDRATSTLLNCVEGTEETSQSDMEKELISIGAVSALSRAIETLIDGRKPKTLTSTLSKTITPDTTSSMNTMLRATEPMTCGLLDLLFKCCSKKDKIGANGCDELHDCGGVQLMMILLDDTRQSVKEKACRLLACVCGSAGRNARDIKRSVWSNSNGALEQLVALVEHRRKTMAKGARRCLDALRNRNTLQNELNTIHRKSSGALTKLTENIRHENSKTSNIGSPAGSAEGKNKNLSDDEVLLPLIEQGIVPIFHRMATEKETLDIKDLEPSVPTSDSSIETKKKLNKKKSKSKKKNVKMTKAETKAAKEKVRKTLSKGFAADYLAWLEIAVCGGKQGGSSTFRVLLRTLCMNGNEELRGHVAIALVILCFQNEILRKSFVQEGAFDATLSMLRTDVGRSHALEFLYTMEPIVRTCVEAIELAKDKMGAALTNPYAAAAAAGCDPPPAELLSERHVNNPTSSDVTLSIRQEENSNDELLSKKKPKQTLWTFHAHKSVLMCCSVHFRDLLSSKNNEPPGKKWEDEKFEMTVRSFEGFEAIMRFVYTADERQLFKTIDIIDDIEYSEKVDSLLQIMMQANELGMGGVRRLCAKRFCATIGLLSEDTVMIIFEASILCGEDRLGMFCFNWILENWMLMMRGWSEETKEQKISKLVGLVRGFVVAEIVPKTE